MKEKTLMKIFTAIIIFAFSSVVLAGGTETGNLSGAKTLSLNGLYFAGNDGINKSLNNPAGIIYMENTGVEFFILDRLAQSRFESGNRGLFKSFRNDEILFSGGIFLALGENLKMAAAYQPASSFNIEWPYASIFQTDSASALLVFDYYNKLTSDAITLTAAYRAGSFSIGLSPVLYRVRHQLSFPLSNPLWIDGAGNAAYQVAYDQEGWAFGFVLGAVMDFSTDLRIGLSVKSGYSADLSGTAKSNYFPTLTTAPSDIDIDSKVEFPWVAGLGFLYNLGERVKLNGDFQYSLWGSTRENIIQNLNNAVWEGALTPIDQLSGISGRNIPLLFRNSFDLGFGIEFTPDQTYSYRFGYRFSQTNNQEENFRMLFPSVDQHWLNIGFGLKDEAIELDGTISYGIGFNREVESSGNNTAGEYGYNVVIPSISLKYFLR
jgi:long-subunit fatty acid transport protein